MSVAGQPAVAARPRAVDRNLLIGVALALVTLAVYGQTVWNNFEFLNIDDNEYVTANPHVQAGLSADGIRWAFTTYHAYNWHPLTWLSLQLDATLGWPSPRGFHLTNILLHAANAVLLFYLLRRMTGDVWPSAAAAALFALHPTHVESVAWITERKDVLSTLFWLLTTIAYVRYVERPGWGRYLLIIVLLALGLMAKPMLVTLPATLLLLDYWPLRRPLRGWLIVEKLLLFALVAASLPLTIAAQAQAIRSFDQLPVSSRAANAVVSYAEYLVMMVWPADLAPFYPHPKGGIPGWQIAISAAVLIAITAVVALARRKRYLLVGWLWYLGTLVPVIGIMQVGIHALADRYTYIPYIGLAIMLAWGTADVIRAWPATLRTLATTSIAALAACAALTWWQVGVWHDSIALWQHTLAVTPNNTLAHEYLARELTNRGRMDEAAAQYREALKLMPQAAWMHGNLGVVLQALGRTDEAVAEFETALRLNQDAQDAEICRAGLGRIREAEGRFAEARDQFAAAVRIAPNSPGMHFELGRVLYQMDQPHEALAEFDEALRLEPRFPAAHNLRGLVLEELGESKNALDAYRKAVELDPQNSMYLANLGFALYEAGKPDQAAARFREATRLDPNWTQPLLEAAWQQSTHPDARFRNGKHAQRAAVLVCQATNYRQPRALDVLAAAFAEIGQFDDAVRYERQTIDLLSAGGPADAIAEARERLHLYESRKPYRQP
jgi:tetratricopeptide (TPR) repeat protein